MTRAPRPAWAMTFEEFLGPVDVAPAYGFDARADEDQYAHFFDDALAEERRLWSSRTGGYSIHTAGVDWEPYPTVFLAHKGRIVGFYAAGMTFVDRAHRRRGLAAEMIAAAAGLAGTTPLRNEEGAGFSRAGVAAHRSAHRLLVHRAIRAGKPVPPAVRAEVFPERPKSRPRRRAPISPARPARKRS